MDIILVISDTCQVRGQWQEVSLYERDGGEE